MSAKRSAKVVDDDAAWLALELEEVGSYYGPQLVSLGVPCRRHKTREAVTRQVFVENDTAWDSPLADSPIAGDEPNFGEVEDREIEHAQYGYAAPRVLAALPSDLARWAYDTFKAAEFDSMYRLRDDATPWSIYVEELRDGMEKSK